MKQLHRITGIIVSIFIGAHLINHCLAVGGIETHTSALEALRKVYRIPVIEILLISSFLFQAISGVTLFTRLRKKEAKTSREQVSMYSGLVLGCFILQHIGATLDQRLFLELDTNFYFASAVLHQSPLLFYFFPYYFAGIMSLGLHVTSIHREKVEKLIGSGKARIHWVVMLSLFFGISIFILLIFGGAFFEIEIPAEYLSK